MRIIDSISKAPILIYVFFIIGLIVRLIPIMYGLPLHLNIDEPALVSGVLSLKDGPNIGRFDWPHLYFYISFLFYVPAYLVEHSFTLPETLSGDGIYFVVSRAMSALFGALTIFPIYAITQSAFKNKKVSILAAFLVMILPVHVFESFYAKLDIPLTFFVSIAVYWILKCSEKLSFRTYIVTGLLIGLCISIKYNAFLLALPFLIAYLYTLSNYNIFKVKTYLYPFVSGLFAILGFIIGTPFAVLDFKTFWSYEPRVGLLWQFQNVGNVPWEEYPINIYSTFSTMYREDLGVLLWIVFLIVVFIYLFFNYRGKYNNILLLPAILISIYISKFDRSPPHYFLFLIPMYLPVMANFINKFVEKIDALMKSKVQISSNLLLIVFVTILAMPSIISSISTTYTYAQTDTRIDAYNWVRANLDDSKDYLYVAGDNLGEVGFQKNNTSKLRRIDPDQVTQPLPVYIVVGYREINLEDFRSNNWNPPGINGSSERVLNENSLIKYFDNTNRSGPPILIFKVTQLIKDEEGN